MGKFVPFKKKGAAPAKNHFELREKTERGEKPEPRGTPPRSVSNPKMGAKELASKYTLK